MTAHNPFQFSQPPRHVPLSIRFSNWFNVATQFALIWTLFSTPFLWIFGGHADLSAITFRNTETTRGEVTTVVETSASENDMSVYAVHYTYKVSGQRFTGNSYVTGYPPTAGDQVTVLYRESDPGESKVEGMRRSMFGPLALIVIIFPAVGVIGLWFTIRWGTRRNRLLAHGVLTDGVLEKNEPTNTTINDEPVMALTFGFTANDGRKHTAVIRTTDTKWLTDEDTEQILYDPAAPEKALALDELDPFPDFDSSGRMQGDLTRAAKRAILPAATLVANLYFLQRFFH